MDSGVVVNFKRCHDVASVLQGMTLPQKLMRQAIFSSDRKVVGNFNLLLVAICHQTQKMGGIVGGKWYRGWDFLQRRLNEYCRSNVDILEVDSWATLSSEYLEQALAPATQDATLLDLSSRVPLINDLGYRMTCAGHSSFEKLYDAVNRRCCGAQSIISFLKCTGHIPIQLKRRQDF